MRKRLKHVYALFFALIYVLSITGASHEVMEHSPHSVHCISSVSSHENGLWNVLAASTTIACGPISGSILGLAAGAHALHAWWKGAEQATVTQRPHASEVMPERIDRAKARFIMHTGEVHVYAQEYVLDDALCAFLEDHHLNKADYASCSGTLIQHALHQESVALLSDTARLDERFLPCVSDYQTILAGAIDAGHACVQNNMIDTACITLDWARSFLWYVRAVGDGIIDGVQHTAHTFTHPRQFIAQLSKDAHELVCITLRVFYECGLIETLIDTDNDALCEAYVKNRGAHINALVNHIKKCTYSLAQPAGVQSVVASATHMFLTGKCLHAIGKFFSFASRSASRALSNIGDLVVAEQYALAVAADGILVNAAQETAQIACRAAEQKLSKARVLNVIAAYEPPAVHIERIAKKYPRWITEDCKPLKHILQGEMTSEGKLLGLHHDYLGYLECLGHIEVVKKCSNGMYAGNVLCNGRRVPKSFFPKDWSPERVIAELDKILTEACEWELQGGRMRTEVMMDEVKIRIVLEMDGRVVTAYPVIKVNDFKMGIGE